MKNLNKIFSLLLITIAFVSCNENDDLKFVPETESGWIQFIDASEGGLDTYITSQVRNEVLKVPVNIQVPNTSSDLTIRYDLVSVSGIDPNSIFTNSIVVEAGNTSYGGPNNNTGIDYINAPTINFDVSKITTELSEAMIFDVVLKSTSSDIITAGIIGENKPVTTRVQICPSLFDSSTLNYLGDYSLSVATGDGPFGTVFTEGTIVTIIEGADGSLSREFQANYLPNINGSIELFTFNLDNGFVTAGDTSTGIGCASEIIITGDDSNIADVCTEDEIVINFLDFYQGTGGCGVADSPDRKSVV